MANFLESNELRGWMGVVVGRPTERGVVGTTVTRRHNGCQDRLQKALVGNLDNAKNRRVTVGVKKNLEGGVPQGIISSDVHR